MKPLKRKKKKNSRVDSLSTLRILACNFYTFVLAISTLYCCEDLNFGGLRLSTPLLWAKAQELHLTLPELDPSETGGTEIVGYDMQIDDGHNGDYRFVLGGDRRNNTLATYVFLTAEKDGIEAGLSYRVRFRAINALGEGPWSGVALVRAAVLPSAPASPVVTYFDAA